MSSGAGEKERRSEPSRLFVRTVGLSWLVVLVGFVGGAAEGVPFYKARNRLPGTDCEARRYQLTCCWRRLDALLRE
jgi:hypothetical protein